MNKNAVALAADSAVTIGHRLAIHNSANKLFQLSNAPVGLITYGKGTIMNVPVDIIINEYSKHLGDKTFSTLQEYVDDFCSFVADNHQRFHFKQFERDYVFYTCKKLLGWIGNKYKEYAFNNRLFKDDADPAKKKSGYDFAFKEIDSIIERDFQKLDSRISEYAKENYYGYLKSTIEGDYSLSYLSGDQKLLLCDKTFEVLGTTVSWSENQTGIVIAGYGEDEIYPSLRHFQIDGVINGDVRIVYTERDFDISEDFPSSINTFAQREIMENILYGMDRDETDRLRKIPDGVREYLDEKANEFLNLERKDLAISRISGFVDYKITSLINSKKRENDIHNSIVFLPPQEIALLAESMINITSILRKVKLDDNNATVGGPVDVAVITKNDGFTWVKRKKQFNI